MHLYLYFLPVVGSDSSAFHYAAYYLVNPHEGATPLGELAYVKMLGFLYQWFGISQFLGAQMTHLAFSGCVIVFVELGCLLQLESKRMRNAVLLYGLLPSCALHAAVTMREIFQAFGFLLLIYGLVRLRLKAPDLGSLTIPIGSLVLLFSHKGFALFLILALPLSLAWATGMRINRIVTTGAVVFAVLFLFGEDLWKLMLENSYSLRAIAEGQGLEYIDQYADQVERGRSDFDVNLKLDSPGNFISTAPVVFIYYLFSPLPWQISATLDLEGFAESLIRMWLLLVSVNRFRSATGEERKLRFYLIAIFLLMEMTWAAGTSNWGTAVRHRLVAWPLLVLSGMWEASKEESAAAKPMRLTRRQKMREIRRVHREKISGSSNGEQSE